VVRVSCCCTCTAYIGATVVHSLGPLLQVDLVDLNVAFNSHMVDLVRRSVLLRSIVRNVVAVQMNLERVLVEMHLERELLMLVHVQVFHAHLLMPGAQMAGIERHALVVMLPLNSQVDMLQRRLALLQVNDELLFLSDEVTTDDQNLAMTYMLDLFKTDPFLEHRHLANANSSG